MSQDADRQQAVHGTTTSSPTAPDSHGYRIIEADVYGTVQWFNRKDGYGFVKRDDTAEDIFLHHTAIKSSRLQKFLSGGGDSEAVKFDIVEGRKGPQAANVTIAVPKSPTSKKHLSEAHLEELMKLKEQQANLKKEFEAVKNIFQKQLADMTEAHETDLQTMETTYQRQLEDQKDTAKKEQEDLTATFQKHLEDHKATARKEKEEREAQFLQELEDQKAVGRKLQQEEEAKFQKQLEDQKASFQDQKASNLGNPWLYAFGGVCVFIGFLSAKCVSK